MKHALLMYDFFWWTPGRRQHGLFQVTKEPLQPLLFECLPSPSFLLPSLLLGNAYELPASVQSFDVESPFCWSSHAIFPHFHQARRQRPGRESKPTMSRCLESMSSKSLESTSRCTFLAIPKQIHWSWLSWDGICWDPLPPSILSSLSISLVPAWNFPSADRLWHDLLQGNPPSRSSGANLSTWCWKRWWNIQPVSVGPTKLQDLSPGG